MKPMYYINFMFPA